MRAPKIAIRHSFADRLSSVVEIEEQHLVQKLVAHAPVEALNEAVLHRLSWRDEVLIHGHILAPSEHGLEANSVPFSLTIMPGLPHLAVIIVSSRQRAVPRSMCPNRHHGILQG